MDLLRLYPLFCPWFCLLSKSDHGVDFGGKLKVIANWLSQIAYRLLKVIVLKYNFEGSVLYSSIIFGE